ncbi:hypothetical protein WMF30_18305 [Sorangium sp. So ce134]
MPCIASYVAAIDTELILICAPGFTATTAPEPVDLPESRTTKPFTLVIRRGDTTAEECWLVFSMPGSSPVNKRVIVT